MPLDSRLCIPGFGLPVNHDRDERLPNALLDWAATAVTVREKNMLAVINHLSDKDDWRRKVLDDGIVERWRREAVTTEGQGFTDEMFDYCIAELRDKAKEHEETGMIMVFDSEAGVVKSDSTISTELKEELKAAVKPLENVPDRLKDWHPGSNEMVLDLVHPSLFPLLYGRSRILPNGTVGLQDCLRKCGLGEVAKVPTDEEVVARQLNTGRHIWRIPSPWSRRFQWLPCEVDFTENDNVKVASYINNLHPIRHKRLYSVIEHIIAKAVPLWSLTLARLEDNGELRINCPKGAQYEGEDVWNPDSNRTLIMPQPDNYESRTVLDFDLRELFPEGLQVIVKLANIVLTPQNPRYEGGSWHVEGQLNERICATALYYYDCENVSDSYLGFRQKIDIDQIEEMEYGQNDYEGLEYLYNIKQGQPGVQDIGRIHTREGRLLSFPNVFQHQVSPFSLTDPAKPGHRKILALFLVDPYTRILSTANVPPQRRDWWADVLRADGSLAALPEELIEEVVNSVEEWPVGLEEAKEIRLELMEERRAYADGAEQEEDRFNFCEH